ncbi:MAG TPA: hypothetical protein VM577_05160, partial [Anaerovoracaceae bacterium]|nr:hypothetical protein [Anaerovoracaceae bacterium]
MKVTHKIIAFALTVCLIVSQFNSQGLTVMAKESTKTDSQLQQMLIDNNSNQITTNGNQLLAKGGQPANLIAGTVTDSSIQQDMTSNNDTDSDLLQDPGIKKIIDDHFAEINAGGSTADSDQEPGITDRFIVKFKNTQAENRFRDKLIISDEAGQENVQTDSPENRNFSAFRFGQLSDIRFGIKQVNIKDRNFSLIKTEDKIKVEDLISKFNQNKLISDVEYIQPDYQMSISSEESSDTTTDSGVSADDSAVEPSQDTPPAIDTEEPQDTPPAIDTDELQETEETQQPDAAETEEQTDVTPPGIQSSGIAGSIITLNYDEELDETSIPENNDFYVQAET